MKLNPCIRFNHHVIYQYSITIRPVRITMPNMLNRFNKLIAIITITLAANATAQSDSLTCVADRFIGSNNGQAFRNPSFLDDNIILSASINRLNTYDITDPSNIIPISQLSLPIDARSSKTHNGYIYICDNSPGNFTIVNVQDPNNLTILSQTTIPNSSSYPYKIAIGNSQSTTTAYLTGANGDILIFDVTNPASPTLITTANFLPAITQLQASGSTLYIAASDLYIYDLSDPFNPIQNAIITPQNSIGALHIDETTLYMSDSSPKVTALDVTNPDAPISLGELTLPKSVNNAFSYENRLYLGGQTAGLYTIDSTDPANMTILGHTVELNFLNSFTADSTRIITPQHIIDVQQTITTHVKKSTTPLPDISYDIAIEGNYAFVATDEIGVMIFDITSPLNPIHVSTAATTDRARKITINQGILFVSAVSVLEIFDISDPTIPTHIGQIPDIKICGLDAQDNQLAIYCVEPGYVALYDITDPSKPSHLDTFNGPEYPQDIILEDDKIHVAGGYTTFLTIDASDPTNLTTMGIYDAPGIVEFSYALDIIGDTAFVSSDFGYLYAINIANPTNPQLISTTLVNYEPGALVAYGNQLLTASYQSTHLFDITDPTNITWTAATIDKGYGLQIKDDYLYSASGNDGLTVIKIGECNGCTADFNNDGQLNFFDVSLFLGAFTNADPVADLNNDTQFNFFDISIFLSEFAAGCP